MPWSRQKQLERRPKTRHFTTFFSKVDVVQGNCWIWRAALNNAGYPTFCGTSAHRVTYLWFVGPIPDRYHVDHLCRNKVCVNPVHLEAVTHQENAHRASTFQVNGTCKRGHLATPETTAVIRQGHRFSRYCLICRRAANILKYARQTEQRRARRRELQKAG